MTASLFDLGSMFYRQYCIISRYTMYTQYRYFHTARW